MKIIVGKKKKKIVIIKNNIAIRIAGKVSRYIDASMNHATPTIFIHKNNCDKTNHMDFRLMQVIKKSKQITLNFTII